MYQWKNEIQNKYQFRNTKYIYIYIYETKHNIKKLIVMDILTSWKQNGEKINK